MGNRYRILHSAYRNVELTAQNFGFGRSFYRIQKIAELPFSGPLNAPGKALPIFF
jgi:hypothetical protein